MSEWAVTIYRDTEHDAAVDNRTVFTTGTLDQAIARARAEFSQPFEVVGDIERGEHVTEWIDHVPLTEWRTDENAPRFLVGPDWIEEEPR